MGCLAVIIVFEIGGIFLTKFMLSLGFLVTGAELGENLLEVSDTLETVISDPTIEVFEFAGSETTLDFKTSVSAVVFKSLLTLFPSKGIYLFAIMFSKLKFSNIPSSQWSFSPSSSSSSSLQTMPALSLLFCSEMLLFMFRSGVSC